MELSWLSHEGFKERVTEIWNKPVSRQNSVQCWNRKLGALRKHLRGWARHHHGLYKSQKENLQSVVTSLDTQAEIRTLTDEERNQLEFAQDDLIKLLREEELKYYQQDKLTKLVANGKTRKKCIFSLEHEGGKIEGQHNLKGYITQFYKELFGPP